MPSRGCCTGRAAVDISTGPAVNSFSAVLLNARRKKRPHLYRRNSGTVSRGTLSSGIQSEQVCVPSTL
jgi:hypothetical protein